MAARKPTKMSKTFQVTLLRLGLVAPDTAFNRRAAAYAKEAQKRATTKAWVARQKKLLDSV